MDSMKLDRANRLLEESQVALSHAGRARSARTRANSYGLLKSISIYDNRKSATI